MHESGPVLAIVCPGQGSQKPGFLASWLELPGVRDQLTWLSATAGIDLVAHGTTSDADTIKDTAVAQPLLVAAGLVTLPAVVGHDTALSGVVGVTAVTPSVRSPRPPRQVSSPASRQWSLCANAAD